MLLEDCIDFVFFYDPAAALSFETKDSEVTTESSTIGSTRDLHSAWGYPMNLVDKELGAFLPALTVTPPAGKWLFFVIAFGPSFYGWSVPHESLHELHVGIFTIDGQIDRRAKSLHLVPENCLANIIFLCVTVDRHPEGQRWWRRCRARCGECQHDSRYGE